MLPNPDQWGSNGERSPKSGQIASLFQVPPSASVKFVSPSLQERLFHMMQLKNLRPWHSPDYPYSLSKHKGKPTKSHLQLGTNPPTTFSRKCFSFANCDVLLVLQWIGLSLNKAC